MNRIIEVTPELGRAGTISNSDVQAAKHLGGNYTSVLSTYVSKFLASKNQNPDVTFTSYGDKALGLANYEYNTNGVVLHVTGTNVNSHKKRIYIEEAVKQWFSPVRTGYSNHQCLRYKFRGPSTFQDGIQSQYKPAGVTANVYIVNNIILVFEG